MCSLIGNGEHVVYQLRYGFFVIMFVPPNPFAYDSQHLQKLLDGLTLDDVVLSLEQYELMLNDLQQQIINMGEACKQASKQSAQMRVVVFGLLNSGKSTLMNALTGHFKSEFFKTGDMRVTVKNKVFQTPEFYFIDTPGLDGDTADDVFALHGQSKADIILFVHHAVKELESVEIELLSKLKTSLGDYATKGIIMVLSRKDSLDEEQLAQVQAKIAAQCEELWDFKVKMVAVSAAQFIKAQSEQTLARKEGFLRLSNLSALQDMLQHCLEDNPALIQQAKFVLQITELSQKLAALKQAIIISKDLAKSKFSQSFHNVLGQSDECIEWLKQNCNFMSKVNQLNYAKYMRDKLIAEQNSQK